jgi:uncharacterized membrane protein
VRFTWSTELPQLVLIAGMFIAGAVAWPRVPEQIPVHWNIRDEVDRYGSRFEGLFAAPLIALAIYGLLVILPRLDPRSQNYEKFALAYTAIRFTLLGFFTLLQAVLMCAAFGLRVPITTVVLLASGALLAGIGVQMPQIQPNWFVGIRTPWTLSSELAWQKTHRLGGWLLPLSGATLAAAGILRTGWALIAAISFLFASVLWLVIYSFIVWREDSQRTSATRDVT